MDNTKENIECQFLPDIVEVLRFLRNYNMKETETCIRRECDSVIRKISSTNENEYLRNSTNVYNYFIVYSYLSNFIIKSPYQIELIQFLFPLFVHLYLDLIEYNYINEYNYTYFYFLFNNKHINRLYKQEEILMRNCSIKNIIWFRHMILILFN